MSNADDILTFVSPIGGGFIASMHATQKAADAQAKAATLQRKQADLAAARQRREAIKQSRSAYAQAQQTAENQGASSTSSSQGGLASITSQMNSNLSFLDMYNSMSDQASKALGEAAKQQSKAQMYGAISSAATQVFASGFGG